MSSGRSRATVYRLAVGELAAPRPVTLSAGTLADTLPPQSVALYVIAARGH
jgi:hypothetical protein